MDVAQNPAAIEALLAQLKSEHSLLEKQIRELTNHLALGADESFERRRLQKQKLATKDRIAALEASVKG